MALDSRLRGNDKSEGLPKGSHHKEDGPGRAPPRPLEMNGHKKFPISVLLDNVRSAYNVGSFFRTCDGAGISKLYLTGYTPRPPRRDITKTALGADASVPFEYVSDPLEIVNRLKNEDITIIAVETGEESVEFSSFAYPYPCCLVFGNEVEGIRPEILSLCDARVRIPMHGIKGSLNVVVSAGIIIYDAITKAGRKA